jgi:RND family efflux transporter MFP subunit
MENALFEPRARQTSERSLDAASAQKARSQRRGTLRHWIAPVTLLTLLILAGVALAFWKSNATKKANAAAASQPEPVETVIVATAQPREHRRVTTSIGTVVATRSITLRNELPGTVGEVLLRPGQVVDAGSVLVVQDVSVEEAELKALEAEAALAETLLGRMERAVLNRATSQADVDRARAERDVALARIARAKALIARKTIRAPFRARVGLADVHPGQYLEAGTLLTSLQGVDAAAFVDFTVTQQVGQTLREGQTVEVLAAREGSALAAKIVALDARTDSVTRNTMVRALIEDSQSVPAPGASVRVRVPVGEVISAVAVPVSALRKGPGGDHVFIIAPAQDGKTRAQSRSVQTGAMLGDEVLILSGLKSGDQVAASGSFKLREGVQVAVAAPANAKTDASQPQTGSSVH